MKTKLLKKLRKKYNWYINKNGYPVILFAESQEVITINVENHGSYVVNDATLARIMEDYTEEMKQKICWHWAKCIIIGENNMDRLIYRRKMRKLANSKKKIFK